jgi:endogenous inhibitor of DNA gyrase (YacG/DUF329 family)
MPQCPVCDAPVDLQTTPTVPFCSDRCRLIDLGRWLDESYGLPERPQPGPGEGGDADEN